MKQKKLNANIMNLQIKRASVIMLALFFLFSCSANTKDRVLLNYLEDNNINKQVLIVISDRSCLSCNNLFSEKIRKYVNNPYVEYILTAKGGKFDTREFEKSNNYFYDKNETIHNLKIIKTSGVIFLNQDFCIDTLIEINPENLIKTLNFIDENINNQLPKYKADNKIKKK